MARLLRGMDGEGADESHAPSLIESFRAATLCEARLLTRAHLSLPSLKAEEHRYEEDELDDPGTFTRLGTFCRAQVESSRKTISMRWDTVANSNVPSAGGSTP